MLDQATIKQRSSNDQANKWLLSIINHEVVINILIKANS